MTKIYFLFLILFAKMTFSGDKLELIPLEVWQNIFKNLHKKEHDNILFASKYFYEVCRLSITYLKTSININSPEVYCKNFPNVLSLTIVPPINDENLAGCIKFFSRLRELDLFNCRGITDNSFIEIAKHTNLSKLSLICCHNLTGEGFRYLTSLNNLYDLDLTNNMRIKMEAIKSLSSLKNLKKLKLSNCSNESIKNLKFDLEKLFISKSFLLTDEGIKYLSRLTNLYKLKFSTCSALTEKSLVFLKTLSHIKKLPIMEQISPSLHN